MLTIINNLSVSNSGNTCCKERENQQTLVWIIFLSSFFSLYFSCFLCTNLFSLSLSPWISYDFYRFYFSLLSFLLYFLPFPLSSYSNFSSLSLSVLFNILVSSLSLLPLFCILFIFPLLHSFPLLCQLKQNNNNSKIWAIHNSLHVK